MFAKLVTLGIEGSIPTAYSCTNGTLPKTGNCYNYGNWPQKGYCDIGRLPA